MLRREAEGWTAADFEFVSPRLLLFGGELLHVRPRQRPWAGFFAFSSQQSAGASGRRRAHGAGGGAFDAKRPQQVMGLWQHRRLQLSGRHPRAGGLC